MIRLASGIRFAAIRVPRPLGDDRSPQVGGQAVSLIRRDGSNSLRIQLANRQRNAAYYFILTSYGSGLCTPERTASAGCACAPLSALTGTFGALRRHEPPEKVCMLKSIRESMRVKAGLEPRVCRVLILRRINRGVRRSTPCSTRWMRFAFTPGMGGFRFSMIVGTPSGSRCAVSRRPGCVCRGSAATR